ncbi:hypothetical protein TYRP_016036 [Tyrophagus putrescentiae]|nr:hypothetical protein TYRP_016036 [Tyrophagus putrescentiae]
MSATRTAEKSSRLMLANFKAEVLAIFLVGILFFIKFLCVWTAYKAKNDQNREAPLRKQFNQAMPPSYDADVVTVLFRKLRSLLMAAQSSEDHILKVLQSVGRQNEQCPNGAEQSPNEEDDHLQQSGPRVPEKCLRPVGVLVGHQLWRTGKGTVSIGINCFSFSQGTPPIDISKKPILSGK